MSLKINIQSFGKLCAVGFFATAIAASLPAKAQFNSEIEPDPPPMLKELQEIKRENFLNIDDTPENEKDVLPVDIRLEGMREAAYSYGARGGLARRTYYIRMELEGQATYLDKVFDFRQLLIPAPSGLLIEPPIVNESVNAMIVNSNGQEAAVSDRIYNINKSAQIVSAPRNWRNYLEREWGEVIPPPDTLRPNNAEDREKWRKWVYKGWQMGVEQADDIFNDDLNQLVSHYEGMVRYRKLLIQDMISPPLAFQVDRGITGGGDTMRVGDRAVEITGPSELKPRASQWQPVNR